MSDHHRRQEVLNKLGGFDINLTLEIEDELVDANTAQTWMVSALRTLGEIHGENVVRDAISGKTEETRATAIEKYRDLLDEAFPSEETE